MLDEPTCELNPKASNEILELLKKLSSNDCAILMATHDPFRVKESSTRVGIKKHERLVSEMPTDEISHADLERIYLENMRD